jgi:hypothetical protein
MKTIMNSMSKHGALDLPAAPPHSSHSEGAADAIAAPPAAARAPSPPPAQPPLLSTPHPSASPPPPAQTEPSGGSDRDELAAFRAILRLERFERLARMMATLLLAALVCAAALGHAWATCVVATAHPVVATAALQLVLAAGFSVLRRQAFAAAAAKGGGGRGDGEETVFEGLEGLNSPLLALVDRALRTSQWARDLAWHVAAVLVAAGMASAVAEMLAPA